MHAALAEQPVHVSSVVSPSPWTAVMSATAGSSCIPSTAVDAADLIIAEVAWALALHLCSNLSALMIICCCICTDSAHRCIGGGAVQLELEGPRLMICEHR